MQPSKLRQKYNPTEGSQLEAALAAYERADEKYRQAERTFSHRRQQLTDVKQEAADAAGNVDTTREQMGELILKREALRELIDGQRPIVDRLHEKRMSAIQQISQIIDVLEEIRPIVTQRTEPGDRARVTWQRAVGWAPKPSGIGVYDKTHLDAGR